MNEKNSVIKFYQSRTGLFPTRANTSDAGIDFFVPKFTSEFIESLFEKNPSILQSEYSNNLAIQNNSNIYISKEKPSDLVIHYDVAKSKMYFYLNPGSRVNIPSGIYCKMEQNDRALIAANKSGIASKYGLIFGAQVVDSGYQGEIHINVINTGNESVRIYEDMKLIQFIETPIYISSIEKISSIPELYPYVSDRGSGGFGSSNEKDTATV